MGQLAKQVIDFRPSKGITTAVSNEIQRNRSEKGKAYAESIGNYDATREHLNFEIVKGGKIQPVDKTKSIPQRMKENLQARGIADPNEGLDEPKYRTVVNFILGGSRDRMREIAFGSQQVNFDSGADNSHVKRTKDIEDWAKDMYDFFSKRYGEDNIVSFVVHLDEKNPHVHLTLLPIDERNRFAYKRLFAGKDKYQYIAINHAIHDDLAKVNAKWGLHRGSDITETGAKHRSTEEYRRQLNDDCVSMEEQLDNSRKTLRDLNKEIRLAEIRVKGLTTMVTRLAGEKRDIETQIENCFKAVASGSAMPQEMDARISELKRLLREKEEKLADKEAKLEAAKQMLDKLMSDMSAVKQRCDELHAEVNGLADVVADKSKVRVTDAMYNTMMEEFKHVMANSDDDTIDRFDETILMDFARRGNYIAQCAVMLLGGYVDQATEFAQGHGGGGGGNDMKWGRDPNEDDRKWARRCVLQANRMMKPASAKKVKR